MKFLTVTLFTILLMFSCKKEETAKDSCTNGFKDPGETKIDCGGKCKACPTVYIPSVLMSIDSIPHSFTSFDLTFSSNNYILSFSNDSVSGYINLGDNSITETNYPIVASGTTLTRITNYGLPSQVTKTYNNITNATYYLESKNTTDQRMSGYFTLKFYNAGSGNDTLIISSGEFTDMSY